MSKLGSKSAGKRCPIIGHLDDSGHGGCPYGFGSSSGPSHGRHLGFGGGIHDHQGGGGPHYQCPFLTKSHGRHGGGFHDPHHGSTGHGDDCSMIQCPWAVARMHACPWAWGVGSDHHAQHGHGRCPGHKGDFSVTFNVKEYCPRELEVKLVGRDVVVHGKHDVRSDHPGESGSVSREFTHTYPLEDDIDPDTVTSSLSADKMLTISAKKKEPEGEPRVVTIEVDDTE